MMNDDPYANVIIFSAMGQQRPVVVVIEFGAQDSVMKPLDEHRVLLKRFTLFYYCMAIYKKR